MAFREVTMVEIREVLRQWLAGTGKKRIAARLGMDPKTVRSYARAAEACGLVAGAGEAALTDEMLAAVLATLGIGVAAAREYGDAWRLCEQQREFIARHLRGNVRLSKVRRLLHRSGVTVPYSTLHRFATRELGFGRPQVTLPVIDGEPGEELQLDTGWMVLLEPDERGRRRKFKAWIFTPCVSRYRFVYPVLHETIATAVEAFEAAWEFYGGVFKVAIPDNTKAIVQTADALETKITPSFLEYAQARGFVIDTTRVRAATDKARVERTVRDVRDDCYGGEVVRDIEHARVLARHWCEHEYGMRRHSTTQRLPREHFDAVEKPALLPAPTELFDVPLWCEPKVARDHFAQVAGALYSLPTRFIGKRLRARADSQTVRFYEHNLVVKTHARQPKGGRAMDRSDFPQERAVYAMRDVVWLAAQAREHGESVGLMADRLLASELPWTKMRQVRALLSLCRKYGDARVEESCARALRHDMTSIHRLARMLSLGATETAPAAPDDGARVIPLGRFLRPAESFALRRGGEGQRGKT